MQNVQERFGTLEFIKRTKDRPLVCGFTLTEPF